jgi:2-polyprenyl-6-methoxyphenol hydroxylase-like FAD-dependent oxidoreductase
MSAVLVVGAGPTGLTLACLLAQRDIDVRIVDRLPAPADVTKAMVIWSRSLEVLEEIGVADAVVAAAGRLERARYVVDSQTVADVRTNFVPGTRWQPAILPQNALERLLRERLAQLGVAIEWGTRIEELTPAPGGVRVKGTRSTGAVEYTTAYAVGCDGLRSAVREAAGIAFEDGAPYEEVFQLGDVDLETSLDRTTVHHFLGRHGVSVAAPLPGGSWRVAGYLDGEDAAGAPDAASLQRLLRECGHLGATVGAVYWTSTFRVVRRLADRFRAGRLLIAGDAAHVHSPAGGQGLNTGIQDAHNLAWKLALVVGGTARDELLDTYEEERRPIAARILRMTQMQDQRLFGARSSLARGARSGVLRLLDRTRLMERHLIPDLAQVRVDYRRSSLTAGSARRRSAFRPGRQVPDVAVVPAGEREPVRLRDLSAAGGVTLLAMPGPSSAPRAGELEALATRYAGAVRLVRPVVSLPGEDRGCLFAIRPDGYIGYRGPCAATPALHVWLRDRVSFVDATAAERRAQAAGDDDARVASLLKAAYA